MKCLFPVRMYRSVSGTITHSPNGVHVLNDFFRPCKSCINCKLSDSQSLAIRMMHESKFHTQNSFLTLTYNSENLPQNNSLLYADVTKFIKKIRKSLQKTKYADWYYASYTTLKRRKLSRKLYSKSKLKFFLVGEYGSDLSRPHYHIILFGFDFSDPHPYKGVVNTRTLSSKTDERVYYKSSFANLLWDKGFIDIGNVDTATCLYAAKYITKKLKTHEYSSLQLPEKSSMSKKIPLGIPWLEKYYSDVYPHSFVVFDGKKFPPPRSYDDWIKKHKPDLWLKTIESRESSQKDSYPDYYDLYSAHQIRLQQQAKFTRDGCAPNLTTDKYQLERQRSHLEELRKGLI